jgi:hypothetical protein
MHSRCRRSYPAAIALIAISVFAATRADAFSSDPPDGLTGAPGEGDCTQCHSNFPLNSGPGSVVIDAPVDYVPGMTYEISVSVMQMGQMRWGFELTVLDDLDEKAGDLFSIDANTQVSPTPVVDREYIKHTSAGTMAGQLDANIFEFDWTAPSGGVGPVTFYAVGNAANNAAGSSGDYIYTTSAQVPEPTALARALSLLAGLALFMSKRRISAARAH